MRHAFTMLLSLLLIFVTTNGHATLCYLRSKGDNPVYMDKKPMEIMKSYSPCNTVSWEQPAQKATLCYANASGGNTCINISKTYPRHTSLDIQSLSKKTDSTPDFFAVLKEILLPSASQKVGMKNYSGAEEVPGFPDGDILLPETALHFNALQPEHRNISELVLSDSHGNTILTARNITMPPSVPADKLAPGQKYGWQTTINNKRFTGGFTIAEKEDQDYFLQDLNQAMAEGDDSEFSKQFTRALIAKKHGYTFDYLQAIQKARDQLTKGEQQ